MLCDNCGQNEAEVHLTPIVDNEMTTIHLCPSCAAEKGLDAASAKNLPLTDFLAQMGQAAITEEERAVAGPCTYCHTTVDDFRRSGRLGCPHCYSVYESQLRAILQSRFPFRESAGSLPGEMPRNSSCWARVPFRCAPP